MAARRLTVVKGIGQATGDGTVAAALRASTRSIPNAAGAARISKRIT
jgi:hypothetical protein